MKTDMISTSSIQGITWLEKDEYFLGAGVIIVDWRKIKKYKRKGLLVNAEEINLMYAQYIDLIDSGSKLIADNVSSNFVCSRRTYYVNRCDCYIEMKSKTDAIKYKLKMS